MVELRRGEDAMLEREMKRTLKDLGIRSALKGYWYIRDALVYMLACDSFQSITVQTVYIAVAEKHDITWTGVERCIRKAVERMFDSCDVDKISSIFGASTRIDRGKLTNKEFLWTLAEHFVDVDKALEAGA